ncbi:hypothetical protein [Sorangium sp. So ce513]|uniref:hypothetical protein n=1 Tax=Sorangium sp. So ce513 TaxID=3133315 RepID=UPI003F5E9C96
MRVFLALLATSVGFGLAASVGCSSEPPSDAATTTTTATVAGAGGSLGFGCFGGSPDGRCTILAQVPESCDCPDCAGSANCLGHCVDDGVCDLRPDAPDGEDCTCQDCAGSVAECSPRRGCNNNDTCGLNEDCTCPDCTNTPRCTDHCTDNGSCAEYFEGCSCADCRGVERCGGSPATTTSSTAATTSSAAATTSSAATTTSSGAGSGGAGDGGAGGGGGAGGA